MGYLQNYFSMGATAFSVEYYNNGDWITPGSEAKSVGISMVQYVSDLDLQVYAAYRSYQAYTNIDIPDQEYMDSSAVLAGLLWQF
jgi:hypothetical protein